MGQIAAKFERAPVILKPAVEEDYYNKVLLNAAALQCPICMEIFPSAPYLLLCGHSFCAPCLYALHERQTTVRVLPFSRLECPLCRTITPLVVYSPREPSRVAIDRSLRKNFVVEAMLDDVRAIPSGYGRSGDGEPPFLLLDETLRFDNRRLQSQMREMLLNQQRAECERLANERLANEKSKPFNLFVLALLAVVIWLTYIL